MTIFDNFKRADGLWSLTFFFLRRPKRFDHFKPVHLSLVNKTSIFSKIQFNTKSFLFNFKSPEG